jgi:TnpA family transposase
MKSMLRKKYNPQQDCWKMLYRYEYFVFKINHVIMFYLGNRIINSGKAENRADYMLKGYKHVELRERALQDQLQRASALNIIINAISVWNTLSKQQNTAKSKVNFRKNY